MTTSQGLIDYLHVRNVPQTLGPLHLKVIVID
jgi:hypothetical protein